MDVSVSIGGTAYTFDPDLVNGLDAWECMSAVGVDVLELLGELAAVAEAGVVPPFHLAVVGKWLAVRQSVDPLVSFAAVAASVTVGGARGE